MAPLNTPLTVVDKIMTLRAKSWRLSEKENDLLNEIHSTILFRSEVDKEIDRLEKRLTDWKKGHRVEEPRGAWGWMK